MGCGSAVGKVIDAVADVVRDTVDIVSDSVRDIGDTLGISAITDPLADFSQSLTEFAINIASLEFSDAFDDFKDMGHAIVDLVYQTTAEALGHIDTIFNVVGIKGSTKMLDNFNEAARWIADGIIEGNLEAIKIGLMIAALVVLTIYSAGAASGSLNAALSIALNFAEVSAAIGLISTVGYIAYFSFTVASFIYSMYGLVISINEIGEAIRAGGLVSLMKAAQDARDKMNLSFVTSMISGSYLHWMAGGIFYDSPRPGNILYNVTGAQDTIRHYTSQQNRNANIELKYGVLGHFHNPSSAQYILAGDQNFNSVNVVG